MLKLGDLLGLPVLEVETGAQIGAVQEAVLDSNLTSVRCILVTGSTNGSGSQQILFRDLLNIGRDAVTVRNSSVMFADDLSTSQECTTQLHELLVHYNYWINTGCPIHCNLDEEIPSDR